MEKIYSRYKLLGGFGLLTLFLILASIITYLGLAKNPDLVWNNEQKRPFILILIGIESLVIWAFTSQCRFIIMDNESITFINPLMPFLRKKRKWSYYDYYIIIDEQSRTSTYEAIWLIKNGRIKNRISSFYYLNYYEIEKSINLRYSGKPNINPLMHIFYFFGLRIKN